MDLRRIPRAAASLTLAASIAALATALPIALSAESAAAERTRIEKADDLPRHTYTVDGKAVEVMQDEAKLLRLAEQVRRDLEADLEQFEIGDKTTLRNYYQTLGVIALIEGRYDDYETHLRKVVALEDKEAKRLTAGLVPTAWIAALEDPETEFEEAFARELRGRVNNLPYEVVEATIKQQKGMMEIATPALIEGMVESQLQPVLDQSGGELTKDMALGLVQQAFAVRTMLPHRDTIAAVYADYLDAHAVEKEDVWAARAVDLTEREGITPVVVAVWDSGVDYDIFEQLDQIWTNPGEIGGNGIDDDGNGFVDDEHGIAFDLHSNPIPDALYPVEEVEDRALLQRRMKGLRDVQNDIESPEATELKQAMSAMSQQEVKPFLEGISAYGNHAHGTHVAGIAVAGNPAARVLGARLTFDHRMIPEKPTLAWAHRAAAAALETVEYFQRHGVRVVNMSWGAGVGDFEAGLAQHNDPADPQERKELARRIFETFKGGLTEAMVRAPEILFCAAAGNSDNDNEFEEMIPSSIDLPNMITVGAVDQAGDETGFTTFGKVDVYANGFNVLSYVPGGDQLPLSGTSMASPNVANLAGKILAVNPDLDALAVKEIMVSTAEERAAGERTVRLIHPQEAIEAAAQKTTSMR